MNPDTFVELRCLVAACRARGDFPDEEIELILYTGGATVADISDLLYRWQ